jgi:general secretion pathway protein E
MRRVTTASVWLLGIALIAGLAVVVTAPGGTTFDQVARAAWLEEPWAAWVYVTAAACALAVVTSAVDRVANRQEPTGLVTYAGLDAGTIKQRVSEIERRVRELLLNESDVVRAFDELVRGAVALEASDIHVSPTGEGLRLTYRVHGTLHQIALLEGEHGPRLCARIKVLARLDTYVHGKPQDGRLVMTMDGKMIDARVSTLPTESGERVVLRFVRGSRGVPELETLGFSEDVLDGLTHLLARPQGLLFLAAPVGSGKTTTLYAAMKHIASTRGSTTTLVTLEDPIELELPFATQTQMHRRAGMTFASTLRSVLRQDPNVLMVGEIRDAETAEIAMQAGLTGHLILTTVHGDGAAGPFARLIDFGVEPFALASATVGCLSQRLVRTLCTACRRAAEPEPLFLEQLARRGLSLPDGRYHEPVGCELCDHTGFTGRVPIAELLVVDSGIRSAVNERRPTEDIECMARDAGMRPLIDDGLQRAARGETSLSEVLRVVG